MSKPLIFWRLAVSAIALLLFAAPAGSIAQRASALTDQPPRSITGIRFRVHVDGPVRGGFALAGNRLLFGTERGSAYAIDARDGRVLWRGSFGSPVLSTPALMANRAFFTTWDNALHAVDVASGKQLWRADLGKTLGPNDYWEYYVSSPIASGGRLYVGSGSGRVFAVDPARGSAIWSADVGARVRTTPLVLADKVIVGTMGGHAVALDRRDGRRLWTFATEGAAHDFAFKHNDTRSVVTQPILVGRTVVVGGRDGNVYGVDALSGAKQWEETHDGGSWILGLESDPHVVYSASGSAFIIQAADAATGKELWRTTTGAAMFGGLAKAGDVLVSNGSYGMLYGLSTAGKELWRLPLPAMSYASPLVAPGVVFTGADDGSVIAADTNTAAPVPLDRYVYSYTNQPDVGFFWFKPEVVATMKGEFEAAGFSAVGNAELGPLLGKPIGEHGRKIIVIADTRLPDEVDGALVRRFLDGGGILVMVGANPLAFSFDATGAPVDQQEAKAAASLALPPPDIERDNGYNVSVYGPRAHTWGLSGPLIANRFVRADKVSLPLALDRTGMAAAWINKYRDGGLLISLPVARFRPEDLTPLIEAVNLIAASAAKGAL
jgi:outer membrane protein assembly factor BamB